MTLETVNRAYLALPRFDALRAGFLLTMALDATLTILGLQLRHSEGNPVFAWLNGLPMAGQAGVVIAAKAAACLFILWALSIVPATWARAWLVATTAVMGAVAAWNAAIIAGVVA